MVCAATVGRPARERGWLLLIVRTKVNYLQRQFRCPLTSNHDTRCAPLGFFFPPVLHFSPEEVLKFSSPGLGKSRPVVTFLPSRSLGGH